MKAFIQIEHDAIQQQECVDAVRKHSSGAISVFIGTVRSATAGKTVKLLSFEAYEPMALKEMQKIADAASEKWPIDHVSIVHRVGELAIGEEAVVIAVSSPHRKEAFAACQFCIDTLKQTVPIWKKEVYEDGATWVAAHP